VFAFKLRLHAAVAVSLFGLLPAVAQEPKTAEVKGTVAREKEVLLLGYVAELDDLVHPGQALHADVAADGVFLFRNIPYGDYVLRITNYYGTPIVEQFVTVREHQMPVDVRLPGLDGPRPASGGVSLRELRHPPAPKAVGAVLAGQRFAESGNYERAAEELRKAVRISPEYAQAHSNLAVQYIRMRQYQQAADEIDRALSIAGPNPVDLCNQAFVRTAMQHYDQAAASAREALRIDPNSAHAHYLLGTLLLLHNEARAEAIAHLERAAGTIEGARASLARLKAGAEGRLKMKRRRGTNPPAPTAKS
jgi:tetratricopeptide (TPR) repeat protein